MHFAGVAIDGPFQLYNALRRIHAGFRPGVDFQFFHGMGVPYVHYPFYRLWGGGLKGSELSRELVSAILYPLVYVVAFRAFTRRWTTTFALTAAAIALTYFMNMAALLFAMNGMLGFRSTVSTLFPLALLIRDPRKRRIAAGVMLGLALLMGTEQGLAAALALVVGSAVAARRAGSRGIAVRDAGSAIGIGVLVLVGLLLIVGGWSGMTGALRYNFRTVPMDQYWYFGAPPNAFVSSWRVGLWLMIHTPRVGLGFLLAIVATILYLRRLWRAPDAEPRRTMALAVLATYGLVTYASQLGIFNLSYAQPCWRCLIIIGFVEATRQLEAIDASRGRAAFLGVPRLVAISALALTALTFTIPLVTAALGASLPHVIEDHVFGHERFSVNKMWAETLDAGQKAVDSHTGPHGEMPVLWSTYAGWLEARNGLFHPSFDYIIHALGPRNRAEYVAKFRTVKPTLVQTMRPTYTQYEQWLEAENWDFYSALLEDYKVTGATPWSLFWDRRATPVPAQAVAEMTVPPGARQVQLPPLIQQGSNEQLVIAEVEIAYTTHNPFHFLPIIGASPRYLIGVEDAVTPLPISLDPWVPRMTFPLVVQAGHQPILHFETYSLLPGASWTPRTIRVSVRHIDAGNADLIDDVIRYFNYFKPKK